jgi:hypothetical protein
MARVSRRLCVGRRLSGATRSVSSISPHRQASGNIPRSEGIRIGDLKYMRWIDQEPAIEELYDLERDPDETTNLIRSSEYAEKLSHLRRAFAEWRVANPHQYDPMPYSKRPEALAKSIDWVRFKTAHPETVRQDQAGGGKAGRDLGCSSQRLVSAV